MTGAALIVFAGLPGVGKTTLSSRVAQGLAAAIIRLDAIEAAVVTANLAAPPVGPIGYLVAHRIAAACLAIGTPVVVDAVNPVTEARQGWPALAGETSSPLLVVEVMLSDGEEHRRRVETRRSDLPGLVVPTWADVQQSDYQPWDIARDGERLLVDGADAELAMEQILAAVALNRSATDR